jgi:hypothetical protein
VAGLVARCVGFLGRRQGGATRALRVLPYASPTHRQGARADGDFGTCPATSCPRSSIPPAPNLLPASGPLRAASARLRAPTLAVKACWYTEEPQ